MQDLVEKLAALMAEKELTLATAESCTGGMLASAITARAGASKNFERGFITYSNQSKIEMLDVDPDVIEAQGAVSHETAKQMAFGAVKNSRADIAVSITGIAGPDGDEHKPVGLVYIGFADKSEKALSREYHFKGSREDIRKQSTQAALELLIERLMAV